LSTFFILGTGRCGTQTLSRVLDSAPDCVCLHEGATPDGTARIGSLIPQFPQAYASSDAPAALAPLFGDARADYFQRQLARGISVGEANPFAYPFIGFLNHEFPDCKFIHLVRNGYDTVVSWEARKRTTYPKPGKAYSMAVAAKPVPGPGDEFYSAWEGFTRRQKITWFWAHVNRRIEDRLQQVPEQRRLLVRLEDLSEERLDEIAAFVGISGRWDRSAFAVHNRSARKIRRAWSTAELAQLKTIAGDVMQRYGYDLYDTEEQFARAHPATPEP